MLPIHILFFLLIPMQAEEIAERVTQKYRQCQTYQDKARHSVTYGLLGTQVDADIATYYVREKKIRYSFQETTDHEPKVMLGEENQIESSLMKLFGRKEIFDNESFAGTVKIYSRVPALLLLEHTNKVHPFFAQDTPIKRLPDEALQNEPCYVLEQEEYNIITDKQAQTVRETMNEVFSKIDSPHTRELQKEKPFGMSFSTGKNERTVRYWIRQRDYAVLQTKVIHKAKELGEREDIITFSPVFDEEINPQVFQW